MTNPILTNFMQLGSQESAGVFAMQGTVDRSSTLVDAATLTTGGDPEGLEFKVRVQYADGSVDSSWEVMLAAYTLDTGVYKLERVRTIDSSSGGAAISFSSVTDSLRIYGVSTHEEDLSDEVATLAADLLMSKLSFDASQFRVDSTPANAASVVTVSGQTVHEMEVGDILHFGDGYIPLQALTQINGVFTVEMSTAVASSNVKLTVRLYDKDNTLLKTTVFDDEPALGTTAEFDIALTSILLNTDVGTATEGRVEIEFTTATTSAHTGNLRAKKAVLNYV